jgi:hypothetical protein
MEVAGMASSIQMGDVPARHVFLHTGEYINPLKAGGLLQEIHSYRS